MTQKQWVICFLVVAVLALGAVSWVIIRDTGAAGAQPEPTEAATEPVTEAATEPTTEALTEPVTEAETGLATEAETEAPTEPATEETTEPTTEEATDSFVVYDDAPVGYSDLAYIGSVNNGNDGSMTIDQAWTENAYSGTSCIRITYKPADRSHWAGMLWLSGAGNYPPGLPVKGVDLSVIRQLGFYARGTGSTKFYIEDNAGHQVAREVVLTGDWQQYIFDVPTGWEAVCVGFGFASNSDNTGGGTGEIYLDDIVYVG